MAVSKGFPEEGTGEGEASGVGVGGVDRWMMNGEMQIWREMMAE